MNYENFKIACKAKGLTITEYLESKGLTSANTGKYKKGGNPSVPLLIEMAVDLEVTTDFLLGLTDKKSAPSGAPDDIGINELKELFTTLSEQSQDLFLEYLRVHIKHEASLK